METMEIKTELDLQYVDSWASACESVIRDGHTLPPMWVYTHLYDSRIVEKLGPYMAVYASVHNEQHIERAWAAGFRLFAWCDTEHRFAPKKKPGKAGTEQRDQAPKWVEIAGMKFVTCPEMRFGRAPGGVTCTGTKDTRACKLCPFGRGNVLFLDH